jgi:hypothetical protein
MAWNVWNVVVTISSNSSMRAVAAITLSLFNSALT